MQIDAVIAVAIQWLIGSTLVYSGAQKARRPRDFAQIVANYRVGPPRLASVFGYALIPLELLCGIALLLGLSPVIAFTSASLLFLVFFVGAGVNVYQRRQIPCGCFGNQEQVSVTTLIRLAVLLLLTAVGIAVVSRGHERTVVDLIAETRGAITVVGFSVTAMLYAVVAWVLLASRLLTRRDGVR